MQINSDAALAAVRLDSEISVRVARKTLDAQKVEGQAALKLLDAAAKTADTASNHAARNSAVDIYG